MNSSKVLLGVLGGVAAGAIAGILFAPAKGSSTRRKITHLGEEYSDELKEKFDDLVGIIADQYEDSKKSVLSSIIKK
jgi:gas vesicle protein